uniref:BAR/IMD domain-containing adapter protein 2-like n=1 Tax=Myxine glutinosa TaxID=7769 RepID=UPI00358EC620
MAKVEEAVKLAESVYKGVMDDFNPTLRNFIMTGRSYEKALTGVTYTAKGYFDALVKLGELAEGSHAAKDLGSAIFQMAEVHRQIQIQMEEALKVLQTDMLQQLEQKLDQDIRYINLTTKGFQVQSKVKIEGLEKTRAELGKIRKKVGKNPGKYGEKEAQLTQLANSRQAELESYVADGYRSAVVEERRRYCFLVDRQCAVTKQFLLYHNKARELLASNLSGWHKSSTSPMELPGPAMAIIKQLTPSGEIQPPALPGPAPPTQPPIMQASSKATELNQYARSKNRDLPEVPNGTLPTRATWGERGPPRQLNESYSRTLPARRNQQVDTPTEHGILARSSSASAGLEGPAHLGATFGLVLALYEHDGDSEDGTMMTFRPGDTIGLLVAESVDGWHYGENERTKQRGWFPFAYTRCIDQDDIDEGALSSGEHETLSSSGSLQGHDETLPGTQSPYDLDEDDDYDDTSPASLEPPSPRECYNVLPSFRPSQIAAVQLKRTLSNDRSGPLI